MIRLRTATLHRLTVIVALLVAGGAMAARQGADAPAFHNSLQGKMLVAKPSMPDRRFAQTVILMVRHDATGAFGLVVNRPLGRVEIKDTAADTDDAAARTVRLPAFAGGPVEPNRAFVIHSTEYRLDTTMPAAKGLAVTADKRILSDIVAGKGPKTLLYVVGYSGWGKGQLEDEMRRNDWYITSADARIVFGPEDAEAKWEKAVKLRLEGI
jgi:putative transcriptional regulator